MGVITRTRCKTNGCHSVAWGDFTLCPHCRDARDETIAKRREPEHRSWRARSASRKARISPTT